MPADALTIGFIPLCDAAPLAVAQEEGHFHDLGLDVTLKRERSWAAIRDNLAYGTLDAAHLLSPIVVASMLGVTATKTQFATAIGFNLNGNAITVSNDLYAEMREIDPWAFDARPVKARTLAEVARRRREAGSPPITFAMVFPYSSHNYLLRYWLSAWGVEPDKDIRIIVVPPPDMVDLCAAGDIDGFCVGEPWSTLAVHRGVGHQIVSGAEIWPAAPEKVLGVRAEWIEANNDVHQRLIRAIMRALNALKTDEGKDRAIDYLSSGKYIGLDKRDLSRSLGSAAEAGLAALFDPTVAGFPWHSKAGWTAHQMQRWKQADLAHLSAEGLQKAFRTDLYREAAKREGLRYPLVDSVIEGANSESWPLDNASTPIAMPADRFIDGRTFELEGPVLL
ncbi:MAG: CmpA/NrtA family ABC transporter substrate-binding protein [Pseudomonadota bacterium]